jgi:hypothetical protein
VLEVFSNAIGGFLNSARLSEVRLRSVHYGFTLPTHADGGTL